MSKKSFEAMSATSTKQTKLPKKLSKPEKERLRKFGREKEVEPLEVKMEELMKI